MGYPRDVIVEEVKCFEAHFMLVPYWDEVNR